MTRPMQEPTYLIMTALLAGPRHGYAILGEIEQLSDTRLRIGTLYAALDRLAGEGLVEVAAEEVVSGRLRRSYRLTGDGVAVLEAETARLETLSRRTRQRLRQRPAMSRLGLAL